MTFLIRLIRPSSFLRCLTSMHRWRISGAGTWTGVSASITAIMATFKASLRSVFRLVFFQQQASSLVLHTMILSLRALQTSLFRSLGPQASTTIWSA